MKKPELTDEDKEVLERLRKARDERKGSRPVPRDGTLKDKWKTPMGSDGEEGGMFQPTPPGVATGIVVTDGPGGVSLYRDGRAAFSVAVPGRPRFEGPADGFDARLVLQDVPVELAFRLDTVDGAAAPGPGRGEETTTSRHAGGVEELTVLRRGDQTMTLRKRHDLATVDAMTWVTVDTAIMGSIVWGTFREIVPRVIPDSVWLEAGLPVRLRGTPARVDETAAEKLRELAGRAAPTQSVTDEQRADAARALGEQAPLAAELRTVHDLRALALALSPVTAPIPAV